ncbi:unnamed protein product [Symbiodinium necroappetens]|uniref:Reverse transcriptase domain-containing protein n=1 Tax=Symbiodinium necroappetens TaxID=1628268 RepID=A0A813BLX4_9DINO|nr:unnamed protein product [Symbiodinium necroappetens]
MQVQAKESPHRKRGPQDEPLSLDAIREVVRGEIQGAVAGMTDRVAALERNLQQHNDRTFQAVETLSAGQADQGLRIAELSAESQLVAGRLTQLEGKVKQIQSAGSTPSTTDGGRVPALIMGGWPPDTPASEVLQKANEMARDLQLQLNMTDAFVPGVRRGFVLIPLSPQDGESEEAMRQRTQACIRRVNSANVSLGRKADGNPAKLWLAVSQPPERRRRAALAGKVKRLIIEAGGPSTLARIEPEWATGTVWFRNSKISSATSAGPRGSTPAGCGWIDVPRIAELLGVDTERLERVWEPLLAALRCGPHFAYNETWMLLHGKCDVEWRGFDANETLIQPGGALGVHVSQIVVGSFRDRAESRTAWKTVCKKLQQERKAWKQALILRAGSSDWNALRSLKDKQANTNWAAKLLDDPAWSGKLSAHMSSIFCKAPLAQTRGAMQPLLDEVTRQCKVTPWKPFSESEMRITMAKWQNHKATGPDGIALEALKLMFDDDVWRPWIAELLNDSLYRGALPPSATTGASVLLPKCLLPADWSDTRPITLSSAVLKWISQLLLHRGVPLLQPCCQHQWASKGKQGVELLLSLRKLARVAHEWRTPFYIVKIDIAKAFDSIAQEALGELVVRRIAREGGLPWEARLWLSLLEARELTFHVDKRQVCIQQSNGVRQGSPDSPVLFAAKIGEALDATLAAVNGGAPPHVGRHKALEPPPHSGAAFMDDTYVWGESPEYVQQVLAELEVRLRAIGLLINAKKTQVISNIDEDPFRFTIGGKTVKPDGPKTVMTILGAPVTLAGDVAPIVAEMQGRARRAFHKHKKVLCSRAPLKDRLNLHQTLVRGAALWGCPAWPVNASLLQAANSTQLLQLRCMITGKRPPSEAWQDWNKRTMRRARALLHQHKFLRWSTHALQLQWNLWGHIGRASFAPTFHIMRWRDLCWWRDQQALPPGPFPRGVRHIGHHNPDRDPERQIGSVAGPQWWIAASDRSLWSHLQNDFVAKFDPPWASGNQLALPGVCSLCGEGPTFDILAVPPFVGRTSLIPVVSHSRPGRAVVLTIAIMGTYLIYVGNSMPPATTPTSGSDDDSDMPLAPPETGEEIHGEGTTGSERQTNTSPTGTRWYHSIDSSYAFHSKLIDLSAYGSDTDSCSRCNCLYINQQNQRPPEEATEGTNPLPDETDDTPVNQPPHEAPQQVPHEHQPDLPASDPRCAQPLRPHQPQQEHNEQPPIGMSQLSDELENSACGDTTDPKPDQTATTCDDPASGNQDPRAEPASTDTMQSDQDEDDEWIEIYDDAEEAPPAEEDEDGWISDVSDTEEEDEEDTLPAVSRAWQPEGEEQGEHHPPDELYGIKLFYHALIQYDPDATKLPPKPDMITNNEWLPTHIVLNHIPQLSNSSSTQLQLDGTSNNPLQVVDNRPDYIRNQGGYPTTQMGTTSSQTDHAGDVLFTQPPHLTATAPTSPSSASGQPTQPDISDLEDQANVAVQQGRAPRWEIEDDINSMRSSIRIGEVSFDISWLQGAGPPTLPPTIPIAPNVVFSARGTVAGTLNGGLQNAEYGMEAGELPLQSGEQFFLEWQGTKREWVRRFPFYTDEGEYPGIIVIFVIVGSPKGTFPHAYSELTDDSPEQHHDAQLWGTPKIQTTTDQGSGRQHYDVNRDYDIDHYKDQYQRGSESWIPESAPQTSTELLQALTKVIHELLQASFSQPNEQVTILAYRACSYLTQMQTLGPPSSNAPTVGDAPQPPPTAATFTLDNLLIEADATLNQLLQGHRDIPRRHLYNEMARVEQLLSDTKHMLAAWGKDPEVPGAHEGIAGIKNALDAMDWCHLAVEEGNIAQIEETLQIAVQATQRSRNYMDMLIAWIQSRFEDDALKWNFYPNVETKEGKMDKLDLLYSDDPKRSHRWKAERKRRPAYANLYTWTTAIWGHPIQLVDSPENEEIQQAETLMEMEGDATPASQAETVMVPAYNRGSDPALATRVPRERQPSHRRRRLQAALANTSGSESE